MRFLIIIPLVVVACGIPKPGQQPPRDGFQYDVAGETVAIVFDSKTGSQPNSVDLQIQVNDNSFDITISSDTGLQSFDGHGSNLTREERNALSQAALDYSKQQNISEVSTMEQKGLYLAFDYLSQSPDNFTYSSRAYSNLSLQNEGITCIKKGSSVKAQWNTRASSAVAENILVGTNWPNNYGCMGRCGADCGWGAPSAWTKDCLDHDACSYRNNASGGASDSNCGDEYNEAADDWMSGVLAGCNGK